MSDTSGFDLGNTWLGQGASWLGNQIGSGINWLGNQFSSGDGSTTAPISSGVNFGGSSFGDPTSFGGTPALTTPGSDIQSFMAGGATTTPNSALSYGGPGANPDSILTNSAGGPSATPPAAAPSSSQSILDDLLGKKGSSSFNPLGAALSAGGLAYNLIKGSPTTSAEKQIKNLASSQSAQGQQLESYINSGTLPPGAQQWVDNQTAAQTAAIKAKYAQLGMSGSTAETQELNNVQAQATAQIFQLANTLLQTGVSETGASSQLYNVLMNAQNADQNAVSSAIQNFVSAIAGGGSGGGTNLTIKAG